MTVINFGYDFRTENTIDVVYIYFSSEIMQKKIKVRQNKIKRNNNETT